MNVFILCTGRCGSTTFVNSCRHIRNFTSGHESCIGLLGDERVAYPANHIEADNRLTWHLGRLERSFGNSAYYVHLRRDPGATAQSFQRRNEWPAAIMPAYAHGILQAPDLDPSRYDVCLDYCRTVTENIEAFLADKSHTMRFDLESAEMHFAQFWDWIGARGDFDKALAEWQTRHNASSEPKRQYDEKAATLGYAFKRAYWRVRSKR